MCVHWRSQCVPLDDALVSSKKKGNAQNWIVPVQTVRVAFKRSASRRLSLQGSLVHTLVDLQSEKLRMNKWKVKKRRWSDFVLPFRCLTLKNQKLIFTSSCLNCVCVLNTLCLSKEFIEDRHISTLFKDVSFRRRWTLADDLLRATRHLFGRRLKNAWTNDHPNDYP